MTRSASTTRKRLPSGRAQGVSRLAFSNQPGGVLTPCLSAGRMLQNLTHWEPPGQYAVGTTRKMGKLAVGRRGVRSFGYWLGGLTRLSRQGIVEIIQLLTVKAACFTGKKSENQLRPVVRVSTR